MNRRSELKRTPMPRRAKRLNPGKGLESGAPLKRRVGLAPGGSLPRYTELRSKPKPAAVNPLVRVTPLASTGMTRKRQRDTGPKKAVRDELKEKRVKDGMCERCGLRRGVDVHHRRGRKMGGTKRPEINDLSNLLLLDRKCHQEITNTNGHRVTYEFEGLLIREDLRDPADVPVLLAGGWFLLDNQGGKTPTTEPERAA